MSKFFIRRPIVAIVIAIVTVILGTVSLLTLPTSQYPNIVPPEIQVQATYAGADAKTLQQAVSTPIEQQVDHRIATPRHRRLVVVLRQDDRIARRPERRKPNRDDSL